MLLKRAVAVGLLASALLCSATAASAAETITYTYDAKGRLIKVVRTGNTNNNVQTCYKYDKADNRVNVTTTTAGPLPPCPS